MKLKTSQKWLLVTLGIVIVLAAAAWRSKPDGKVHVYFLDVGQGDATLIVKGDIDILIDGGPSPQAIDQELGKRLPFWDRTIELLVMTHPHADHLAGLVEVLSRYKVEQVLYPALASSDPGQYDKPLFDEWLRLISEKNVISTTAQANQELALGGIVLDVLNPPSAPLTGTQSDVDNNGLIIRAQAGDMSFLVTGDVMSEGEQEMAYQRLLRQCTVLKVAHHGSDTSSTDGFLNTVMPQIAVISVGVNDYGLPTAEVVDRLTSKLGAANLYRTDQSGTIECITDGKKLWIKTS
jgi:competence protein ComEC